MSDAMTAKERENLGKIVRLRAKVTKAGLDTLAADRAADVERQLSTIHQADAAQWKDITALADQRIREADAEIARLCEARGIRASFRPSLHVSWYGRGENASAERRAELRKLALARIAADRKAGVQLVEVWMADKLTVLVSGSLTSDEAKAFLESLPSPETLLPAVRITPELDAGATDRVLPTSRAR